MPHYTAMHWGIYEIDETGPDQISLKPYRNDPDPNPIGLHVLDGDLARLRIQRPAVRQGWLEGGTAHTGTGRGKEPFVEVDWPTATALVAREIDRVRTTHGNSAIFGGSYGWSSAGRFHHAQSHVHRFLNMLGGYTRSVDTYSLGAGRALMPFIVAPMDDLSASHTSWELLEGNTELFVAFGGVPLKNTQVASGGAGEHRARAGLARLAAAGTRFINISPVRDNLVTGGPVEWIPIRPNTDVALMLGLAWQVLHDPRFDRGFVDRYCVGFDRFRPYLTGATDGVPKTPAWAAAITGVPVDRIVALADDMLRSRTMLNCAWALQRAAHGEQPFWMIVTLAAMLGQIGLPGGGFGVGYGPMNTMGTSHPKFRGPALPQGTNGVADFIPVARIADMLLNPGKTFTYCGETRTYPDIRLVYWAGGNPFHHHQDLNRLRTAWRRPETIVVHEQFWTPTARHADIILPATTSLERNDIGFATREGHLIAMRKATVAPGEARDDFAIFTDIAKALDAAGAYTEGLDESGWLRRLYQETMSRIAALGINLPDFEAFWEEGILAFSRFRQPTVLLGDFRADPVRHRLGTPSGRIEIFSERIAGFNLPDCPGHPVWLEPFEWLGGDQAGAHPIHLLSDQPSRRLHSQLDPSPYSRAGKIAGREPVYLNPDDAARRGIVDGDVVELFNDRGRCLAGAIVSDDIMPGVARLATGAWFDPWQDGGDRHGNPNVLTLDRGASGFSQGCSAHTCLVEFRKFEGALPPIRVFTPPVILQNGFA
ncbi:molybdopterin-dependent oxidoreductase [Rhodopila sp.]|uniref:molybdopterin-dependent oxidoreductase n=1 Tax=Rhodopila sp. TaxID=2480087 RepID=UPI002C3DEC18|nr:molybdopterin-dependent oxidoreductase [Rhodopila sp.]HVZ08960.1 molybdopterin-dependent oxidoreductase [Rhodopila sp.]